mgnify:CR=1 FL=1
MLSLRQDVRLLREVFYVEVGSRLGRREAGGIFGMVVKDVCWNVGNLQFPILFPSPDFHFTPVIVIVF